MYCSLNHNVYFIIVVVVVVVVTLSLALGLETYFILYVYIRVYKFISPAQKNVLNGSVSPHKHHITTLEHFLAFQLLNSVPYYLNNKWPDRNIK